jgi:hypothetical protein
LASDEVSHRLPSARRNPAIAQRNDAALRLKPARKMLHDSGLAAARRSDDVQNAVIIKVLMGAVDEIGPRQANATNFIMDLGQDALSFVREPVVHDPQIVGQVDEKPMLLLEHRQKRRALKSTAGAGACIYVVKQDRPQVGGAVTFSARQHGSRAFPSPEFIVRTRRLEVKHQNLEMAQQLPDRFVVGRSANLCEICAKNVNEVAHIVGREIRALYMHRK